MALSKEKKGGLALSGGGARGAYQAGVLRGLAEISEANPQVDPFRIITGVSSGAVNSAYMAAQAHNFREAAEGLCKIWANLKPNNIFKVDSFSLFSNGAKVVRRLMFGGMSHDENKHQVSLLNTKPSQQLFSKNIPFGKIAEHIEAGHIEALALSATDYASSIGVTFVQGKSGIKMWEKVDRFSTATNIVCEHVLASSAIPIFFPAVKIGQRYFGDGCLRNTAPLSPAIHLGVNKLIVIGVRKGFAYKPKLEDAAVEPGIGRILNTIINAVLMDGMEMDLLRMQRMNETLKYIDSDAQRSQTQLRPIDFIYIKPSRDIGEIAKAEDAKLPKGVRYLLSGLGNTSETSDIISYLLFEGAYCRKLIDLGYQDCLARKAEIIELFAKN